jgi:PAN domain-containing protein
MITIPRMFCGTYNIPILRLFRFRSSYAAKHRTYRIKLCIPKRLCNRAVLLTWPSLYEVRLSLRMDKLRSALPRLHTINSHYLPFHFLGRRDCTFTIEEFQEHMALFFDQYKQHIPLSRPLKRQNSNTRSPCPASGGTAAGDTQQFSLLCGSDLPGDDIDAVPATSLLQCIDLCSAYHPRCDAVSYQADEAQGPDNCYLKYAVGGPSAKSDTDSATAIWPATQEDCTANGTVSAAGYEFQTYCGLDYPRDDMTQSFTSSLQGCLELCANQASCLGVSYEASMAHGYNNCYLKSSGNSAGLFKQQFVVDTAFRLGPASSSASSSMSRTTLSSTPTTSTLASSSRHHSSNAWIAGAVVGPLAFISLIAAILFCVFRRRHRTKAAPGLTNDEMAPSYATYRKDPVVLSELDSRPVG